MAMFFQKKYLALKKYLSLALRRVNRENIEEL